MTELYTVAYLTGCAIALGIALGDKVGRAKLKNCNIFINILIYSIIVIGSWVSIGAVISDYGSQLEKYLQDKHK